MSPEWQVTIDCADPQRLVEFWCEVLGYVPEPAPQGWDSWRDYWLAAGIRDDELVGAEEGSGAIVDPGGVRPRVWFQEVPEPKTVKNRLHLDVRHTPGRSQPLEQRRMSVDAEVERLVALGASVAYVNAPAGADFYAVTLRDPEGNEFCLT